MAVWEGRNIPSDGMHPLGHMVFESVWKSEVYYRTELCFFLSAEPGLWEAVFSPDFSFNS